MYNREARLCTVRGPATFPEPFKAFNGMFIGTTPWVRPASAPVFPVPASTANANKFDKWRRAKVRIAIGSDQAGHAAKERIAAKLVEAGHEVTDANSAVQSHGCADYAEQVAMLVLRHNAERGIIVTSRVVGASVAANRIPGIRAASCHDAYSASVGAKAEGMNVLVLAVHLLEQDLAQEVVDAYLGCLLY